MSGRRRTAALALAALGLAVAGDAGAAVRAARLPREVTAPAVRLRDAALAGTGAWDLVASLTTEVGPRLAGSEGDRRAVEWALRTMKWLGLANVHAEPVTVPRWERGEASGRIVAPYAQPLVLAALGGSVGTPDDGLEAEVVRVASLDELAKLDAAAVAGRIVFVDQPMRASRDGAGYGETVKIRNEGPELALARGAVGYLIRSVGPDATRHVHTGSMRHKDLLAAIPAAALSTVDADLLTRQMDAARRTGQPTRVWFRLTSRVLADATSANVVGEVRGRERPDEVVLLGAHLDSWDLGTGAEDDAAGCAIVLETARRLLASPPRRTVRVVLFANEEFGLSGGKAYATAHAGEAARMVAAMESDLGSGRPWQLESRVGEASLGTVAALRDLLAPLKLALGGNDSHGGSDISPLRDLQVPILALSPDASRYFDVHHTADDVLSHVDRGGLDAAVAGHAALAWALAEMPDTLARPPVPEPAK